jgi:hypothetical protein
MSAGKFPGKTPDENVPLSAIRFSGRPKNANRLLREETRAHCLAISHGLFNRFGTAVEHSRFIGPER